MAFLGPLVGTVRLLWRKRGFERCPGALLLVFLLLTPVVAAGDRTGSEYEVKAAFLYNFARFAEWPEPQLENREAFTVGILGRDPFGSSIERVISGKTVKGLPIRIVRASHAKELRDCLVVFVSSSEAKRLSEHLSELNGAAVLTVGDAPDFARQGGMIGMFLDNSRVRFMVNRDVIQESGLKVSSTLLTLAHPLSGGRR